MDPTRLRQFLKIVELGSMTEAARAVHLTQPALSRNLQQLESEIGVALFDRRGRGLVLSAAGRALVTRAHALLDAAERASREVARAAERAYFDIRLGSVDSAATFVLPKALDAVLSQFDRLSVKLATARTSMLLERVRRGELDVAIVAHSGPPPHCDATLIARYELSYYGLRDRFADLGKVKRPADLVRFPIVEIEPSAGAGMTPEESRTHARVSNVATVKAMVLAGIGVGDLPDFMLTPEERRLLVGADIEHDPHCGLFLVRGETWQGTVERKIADTLVAALRSQLRANSKRPSKRRARRR